MPNLIQVSQSSDEYSIRVGDLIVHTVRTAIPAMSLRDALSRMRQSQFRHLPIVDGEGKLIGLVSDRDILQAWAAGPDVPISSIMRREPQAVRMDTPALSAAYRMLHDKIGSLPVVDDHQRVVGIITETDFLALACRALVIYEHWPRGR